MENKIKQTLFNHQSEVDADAIWAAIEPEVDAINRKRKRRGFIWFLLVGVVLVGSSVGYFYQKTPSKTNMILHPVAVDDKNSISGNNEAGKQPNNEKPSGLSTAIEGQSNNNFTSKLGSTPELTTTKNKAKSNHGTVANGGASTRFSSFKNKNESLKNVQTNLSPIVEEESPAIQPLLPYTNNNNELGGNLNLANTLLTLPFSPLENEMEKPYVNELLSLPTQVVKKRRKELSFAANLQGSLSFVQRKLELKDSLGLDLLPLRKKTERELEAFQVGLGIMLQHRSGLNLSTGLNYTQINERFQFNETILTVDSIYDVKYLIINLNDDTVAIYGDVPLEKKTTYQKEYYNKYRMLDVPVLLGYRHEGHDFAVGVQAGVFVNLNLATKGQFLKSSNETVNIDTAGIFKPNVGLSYYFGLTAGYLINENLEVYASPFVRHFAKDFTKDNYALKQRYNLYGVNIGLWYQF
ncbi:MAG: hypothetical protein GC192_07470 [Bacteroidetes bacterium]|nr:hypothetical protein [Bacteroidota bacterium]